MQKLELTWIGKNDPHENIEPRILIENPEYSYGEVETETLSNGKQWNGNMLIHGDNLLALKSLESDYSGCVKCIYIDPPYNTGNAFSLYDDMQEHSIWLNLMNIRFNSLYSLLKKDGFLFVNLDEQEHAYAKVLLDGIFGRKNFIGDIIWQKRKGGGNDSRYLALDHDYILVYAKDISKSVHPNKWKTRQTDEYLKRYKEEDENNRYYWDTVARNGLQSPIPVSVKCPDGTILSIKSQMGQESIENGLKDGTVRLAKTKNGWTLHHKVYMKGGQVPRSIFSNSGTNKSAADEMQYLFHDKKSFPYPKPELLIKDIIELSSSENDIILDSFLGSGTTAAVAHKMGRKYIGVEMGNHAYTHCAKRLQMVIDGTDQGGISKEVNWQGGGGFKFYELAPSLLKEDEHGQLVINKEYNADMLAAAMAKQEGFTYAPSSEIYWKQGTSSEQDFIYTTTQFLTVETLDRIYEEMAEGESLLICCTAFQKECKSAHSNVSIKKIPKMLLGRCEFGKDNYNLNIISIPEVEEDNETEE